MHKAASSFRCFRDRLVACRVTVRQQLVNEGRNGRTRAALQFFAYVYHETRYGIKTCTVKNRLADVCNFRSCDWKQTRWHLWQHLEYCREGTSERQMQMCTAAEGLEFLAGCLFAAGEMAADHAVFWMTSVGHWDPQVTCLSWLPPFGIFILLLSLILLSLSLERRSKTQSTYNHQYLCLGFCAFFKNWFSQYCTASPRRPQRVLLCSYLLCPCGATRAAAGASEVPKIDGFDMHWYSRYGQEIDSVSGSHWKSWFSSCSWFLPEELTPQLPERHSNSLRLGLGSMCGLDDAGSQIVVGIWMNRWLASILSTLSKTYKNT